MRNRKPIAAIGLLAFAAITLAACSGGSDKSSAATSQSGTGAVVVEAGDFFLSPAQLAADPGQALTVTFKNGGAANHTFTIDALNINETVSAGAEKQIKVTAAEAGSFEFYCRFHKTKMRGTLKVGDGGSAAATPTAASGYGSGYSY